MTAIRLAYVRAGLVLVPVDRDRELVDALRAIVERKNGRKDDSNQEQGRGAGRVGILAG